MGFLMPKKTWDFAPRQKWPAFWMGTVDPNKEKAQLEKKMSLIRAWSPYLIVVALLLITRNVPAIQDFLTGPAVIKIEGIFGTPINQDMDLLWSPGAIFVLACGLTYFVHRMTKKQISGSWKIAGSQIASADRKSTRLNSSHVAISYAVFCLRKKKSTRRRGTRR